MEQLSAGPYAEPAFADRAFTDRRRTSVPVPPYVPPLRARTEPRAALLVDVDDASTRRGRRSVRRVRRPRDVGHEAWGQGNAVIVGPSVVAPPEVIVSTIVADRVDTEGGLRSAAADRIERVALRVRRGELRLLGLTAGMTDAGALAAALAALLLPRDA